MLRTFSFLLMALSCCTAVAQDSLSERYYDVAAIPIYRSIAKGTSGSFLNKNKHLSGNMNRLDFSRKAINAPIANKYVTQDAIIRFHITNSADTSRSLWFLPGFYFWDVLLYREENDELKPLPRVLPRNEDSLGYRMISVAPHDSMTIVARLSFAKTYLNRISPLLIDDGFLPMFIDSRHGVSSAMNVITYIFCGLLLMMILYSLAIFFQAANREFLYYSAYAFFLGLMLFLKTKFTFQSTPFAYFQEEYLDFIMQSAGIAFYMVFMQKYLATKVHHPFLHRIYNLGVGLLILSSLAFTYYQFFAANFVIQNTIENVTKISLLLWVAVFLVYAIRSWSDKLLRYLFWGNLCLLIFSLISLLLMMQLMSMRVKGIFGASLLYYEIGLFLELVFFLAALNHKNRRQLIAEARERERLKAENFMKEYEKELAVYKAQQEERERISADMHDELGAGMTAIRLMSEIARNKMKDATPVEIDKISQSADDVLNKMNAIIWSMNSGNDTMDNLVSYIRSYAQEYFESTPITCKIYTPDEINATELTGDKRRNIFLCVKESLHNVLKHSKASVVKIEFYIEDELMIRIKDNGVGIDKMKLRQFGNGLKNINNRMQIIGGKATIDNDNGTVTELILPLHQQEAAQ